MPSDSDQFPIFQMPTATRQDIMELRKDLKDHADEDRQDFKEVNKKIQDMSVVLSQAAGMAFMVKWGVGLGIPTILAALVTLIIRHW